MVKLLTAAALPYNQMMIKLLAAAAMLACTRAQSYGGGLGKSTYSVSDAHGASQWLLSMLAVVPDHPDQAEQCGQVGRTRVATDD